MREKINWFFLKIAVWCAKKVGVVGNGKKWTEVEENFIMYYDDETTDNELSQMLGRTAEAIRMKRYRLNTKDEDTLLDSVKGE